MSWLKILNSVFFVRCEESVPCPCCGEELIVIGSRRRISKNSSGQKKVLVIRRKRCTNSKCNRIHHELPDCLVPYKRYESTCIEQVVSNSSEPSNVAADNATLYRLKVWFNVLLPYLISCFQSILLRLGQPPVEEPSVPSLSPHQRIGLYVGNSPGWLARIVRPVVNINLWRHTRSTFLSKNT